MKHRFFHAFTMQRLMWSIDCGLENKGILVATTKSLWNTQCSIEMRYKEWKAGDEKTGEQVDFSPIKYIGGIYTQKGFQECLQAIEELKPKALILIDHAHRTSNITNLIAETEEIDLKIISATLRRIFVEGEEGRHASDKLDTTHLYGRPLTPDFEKMNDEEYRRCVKDNTLDITEDLFPVYEVGIDSIDFNAFVAQKLENRAPRVSIDDVPMLMAESINQLWAYRGTGKTVFAMSLGLHLAAGESFANFKIPEAVRVVYVEGELPESQAQARAIDLAAGLTIPVGNFTLIASSRSPRGTLTIATEGGRAAIAALVEQYEAQVLILDSLKMLGLPSTMDPAVISDLNQWLKDMRISHHLCIVTIHQAGVSGEQRGLSDLEDPLDLSIKLKAGEKTSGASFHMSFTKEREKGELPEHSYVCENGVWQVNDEKGKLKDERVAKIKPLSKEQQIVEMINQKVPWAKIQEKHGVSPNTIARIRR
jgi:hypothetical protein